MVSMALRMVIAMLLVTSPAWGKAKEFTDEFMLESCEIATEGVNPYFDLTPKHRLTLETPEGAKGPHTLLVITVLDETIEIDGRMTRIVEERESDDGVLVEVSRNYFGICTRNGSLFYFGEDVDIYDDTGTNVVSHEGGWRAGVGGARAGVIMPGLPLVGARFFQELAPDVALDRSEIVSLKETLTTPAGTFENCLRVKETSPLERRSKSTKIYAPNVGLVQDDEVFLTKVDTAP